MAPPAADRPAQEGLPRDLPRGRVCLHHHPDLPVGPDRLHGLHQGRQPQRARARPLVDQGGGAQAVQVLQLGDPQGQLRPAHLCRGGSAMSWVAGRGGDGQ